MRLSYFLAFMFALFGAAPALAQSKTMLVLDGSGSMWGQIGGVPKIEIARDVLRDVLSAIPGDRELGLIVYGHRREKTCTDIEVAVPAGVGTAERIVQFAESVNPKGMTPLTDAVRVAAEELKYEADPTNIILVTNGIETCHADPCAVAEQLEERGIDLTVHVVGFGISDEEGKQVACLAERTGGRYLSAANASELSEALAIAVAPEEPETVPEDAGEPSNEEERAAVPQPAKVERNLVCVARLAEDGTPMASNQAVKWEFLPLGEDGDPAEEAEARINDSICNTHLAPGRYLAKARLGNIVVEQPILVTDDSVTQVEAIFNAGKVTVTAKNAANDALPMEDARLTVASRDGMIQGRGILSAFVSAGPVTAIGRTENATVVEERMISAGEEIEIDLILGSGTILPSAAYAEGRPVEDSNSVTYELIAAEPNAEGERAVFYLGSGAEAKEVPAGRYLLRARRGQAEATTPIVVQPGQIIQPTVNLNAGTLYVNAPSAYRIEFLDAFGTKTYGSTLGEEAEEVFNAGAYKVRVTYDEGAYERYFVATVQAGERTEVKIEYEVLSE